MLVLQLLTQKDTTSVVVNSVFLFDLFDFILTAFSYIKLLKGCFLENVVVLHLRLIKRDFQAS